MATPPSSRGSSLDHTFRPPTPESRPVFNRSTTSMVAPKSEYLRHALQQRRAQNTPTPSPIDALPPRPAPPAPSHLHTPAPSPDAFDEFDLSEELMTPESPIRRRRPNDDTPPRGKTNQELSAEVEKLKDDLIQQNIRVELLKKNNHELHTKWVQAKQAAEQLEPLEEENVELLEENKRLKEKLDGLKDYEDQMDDLKTDLNKLWHMNEAAKVTNETLKQEVLSLTKISNEAVASMQDQHGAFDEAVEMIANLESEKLHLEEEVNDLKGRVAAIESRQVDGSAKYPQRIHSIDEQRPVTSYDDSDYYSGPATPRPDLDRDSFSIRSKQSTGASVRSKRFIEMTEERTQSARNLSKRMSDASLRAASLVSVHVPEVPQIPEEISQGSLQAIEEHFRQRRYRQEQPDVQEDIATAASELRRPATAAPQVQTHQLSGLRSLYRPDQLQHLDRQRPLSSYTPSSSRSTKTRPRHHSVTNESPALPPRVSSRQAHTTNDGRVLDSNTTTGTLVGSEQHEQEQVPTTRVSHIPNSSGISILTSPTLDRPDTERWWKDTKNVTPLRTRATTRTLREGFSDDGDSGSRTFATNVREGASTDGVKSATTPAAERPEKDFLFNPRESEDQFMRKTVSKLKGSIRRRKTESD